MPTARRSRPPRVGFLPMTVDAAVFAAEVQTRLDPDHPVLPGEPAELRDAARERVAASGVKVQTAAELGGAELYPALHELDNLTARDIPTTVPFQPMAWEDWIVWFQPPRILPERVWVATVDGRPVGL